MQRFCVLLVMAFLACAYPAMGQETLAVPEPADSDSVQSLSLDAPEDEAIGARLLRVIRATGWFEEADVIVNDGIVTLDGIADTVEHRKWATELAQNTDGAIAVINRMEIEADLRSTFTRAGDEVNRLLGRATETWPLVVLGIAIILIAWFVSKGVALLARYILAPRVPSPLLLAVLVRVISIPVLLLGLYFVLQVAGLTRLAMTILGGTGLVGIIIGFAFRDIAENFLASLLLSVRNPFSSGDLIEVAGETGVVKNLNTRSTVLLTLDGNHVQIPNATVFKSIIKNFSSIPSRRAEFGVGIDYDSSISQAQKLIQSILEGHPAVLKAPEPNVLVEKLGDATVDLKAQYWYDSAVYSPARINSALLRLTKKSLLENGIGLPDPAREIIFPKGIPGLSDKDAPGVVAPKRKTTAIEDDEIATKAEGDLASDASELDAQPAGVVPESTENLLKN